jgi:hypothetical protein
MSSTDNILLDPIPELTAALQTNTWGIDPSSEIIVAECFPITPEDIESVKSEVKSRGGSKRVVGKARIVNLERVTMIVVLDQRGFTVSRALHLAFHPYPFTLSCMLSAVWTDLHQAVCVVALM